MNKTLAAAVFTLATLIWAAAQQTGGTPDQSGGQTTSPSSQMPSTGQQQMPPGSAGQSSPQTGAQTGIPGQVPNAPITEGCLGGSNPNFTITDSAGKTYKLNVPAGTDVSSLSPHVGESVQVMGDVKQTGATNSIDATRIGRGTGKCPGSTTGAQPTPKQ